MNNPAARLLNILVAGKKINPNTNCRKAWCQLLEIPEDDKALFLPKLGKVLSLSGEIFDELSKIDGIEVQRYMHWCLPVENAFSESSFNAIWNDFSKHLSEHVFNYLTMTADYLSYRNPQPILPKTEIDKITHDAADLLSEIISSSLPEKVKSYMINQLKKIIGAASDYKITGAQDVIKVVEETFGHSLLKHDLVTPLKTEPMVKKFWAFMANAAVITTIATGSLQLAPIVSNMLPEITFEIEQEVEAKQEKVISDVI